MSVLELQKIYKRCIITAKEEFVNLPIWFVVCFIYGIVVYFSLLSEPSLIFLIILCFSLSLLLLFFRKFFPIKTVLLCCLFFNFGLLVPTFKFYNYAPKGLSQRITSNVIGEVEAIKPKEFGWQILLKDVVIDGVLREETPTKVRFNLHDIGSSRFLLGDILSVRLALMPPPGALLPGGYDFSRQAYFNEIGAVGYNKSDPIIVDHNQLERSFYRSFQTFRRFLYDKIIESLGEKNGNFAAAVIVGETSGIDLNTLNAMRRSGLAHILCVSGIHLSLVAMIFFLTTRFMLNSSNYIANQFNIKRIGALVAIVGSFLYLLISGMQVAATRAFIMTSVYMMSIFLDKRPQALRSVFFAAMIILIIWPEYIIHPSFILSFTAVLSLIACAKFNFTPLEVTSIKRGKLFRFKQYIILNINSTLAASLATTPFVLYFFHVNPNYSLLANLLAVPITTFILMPSAVLAIMLMPLKIDWLVWPVLNQAINGITSVASFIAPLPYSSWYFGHLDEQVIILYSLAFVIFCVGKKKLKIVALILLLLSFTKVLFTPKVDMIIDGRSKVFAVNINGQLKLSNERLGKLKSAYWTSWFGQSDIKFLEEPITEFKTFSGKLINFCQKDSCNCNADLIINLTKYEDKFCKYNYFSKEMLEKFCKYNYFSKEMLEKFGIILVFCNSQNCWIKQSPQQERFKFK
ncbi:MAG: ComEC/Rec2 family protein [Rickettsiaceae bacterium]|nr:ComEC/Rec2 family protein [Rickettsiaceae bacterium]